MPDATVQDYRQWHMPHIQLLVRARKEKRLHHALLLQGPRSMGKRHFAERLSHFLLCADGDYEQFLACGSCASCELLAAGTHPDLHRLISVEGKQIAIDTVRQARDRLVQTPQVGQSKVCLIEPADALNENSASALLKLLEEPPPETYFLLVADNPQLLMPTIKSRCLPLVFHLPDAGTLKAHLASITNDLVRVDAAMQSSRGFPEKAINLVADGAQPAGENTEDIIRAATDMAEYWLAGRRLPEVRILELSRLPLEPLLDTLLEVTNKHLVESPQADRTPAELEVGYRRILEARRTTPRNPNARLLLQALNVDVTEAC